MDADDVLDYMVMEAVAIKVSKEDEQGRKQQEQKEWRRDKEGLDHLRNLAG